MNTLIEFVFLRQWNMGAVFFDAALKSVLVLAAAITLYHCCRRASAATRHLILLLAMACLIALPPLSFLAPAWQRPLWALSAGVTAGNQFSMALEMAPTTQPHASLQPKALRVSNQPAADTAQSKTPIAIYFSAHWFVAALLAWLVGVLLVSFSIIRSHWRVETLARRAAPLQSPDWSTLVADICARLRLRRRVKLMRSTDPIIPITFGWLRPVILLPAAADDWPEGRRRMVLLHELAHIRRWDCLTHAFTRAVCALYWFNPLVWLANRQMCAERERACDDLVLKAGCKASDYATALLEIARAFRPMPHVAGIAMARSSKLDTRIIAIVDASRARALRRGTAFGLLAMAGALAFCQGGCKTGVAAQGTKTDEALREQQIRRLQTFSAAKEKQSRAYAAQDGDRFFPDFATFFRAAIEGDGRTVTNMYESFKRRHGQYEKTTDDLPHKSYWSPVLEVALAYYEIMAGAPKYEQLAIDGIIKSIPSGSIYFGGTDPGRGLPTAFSKSHADGDPFFTLTQNALADGTYLDYLRRTYRSKIYTPTEQDSQQSFQEYIKDAERRMKEDKLKAGEDFKIVDGKVQVSGQVAVMAINAALAKIIFDRNPEREFYVEESFPLDWMYPHLSPNGLIMKINRQALSTLPEEIVQRDHEYWRGLISDMIGGWLTESTSVQTITDFVDKVYVRRNLQGFSGDPRFVGSPHAQKLFSKLRSSIAGVYAWHAGKNAINPAEQKRMSEEADFAFRQAFAICPHSPEAVFRYINSLVSGERLDDAILIADVAMKLEPANKPLQDLGRELQRMKDSRKN